MTKKDNNEYDYGWKEWEMMNKDQESAIDIPGKYIYTLLIVLAFPWIFSNKIEYGL